MSQGDVKPPRSWRDIAQQVAKEDNPDAAVELAEELIRALDAESRKRMAQITPEDKANEKGAA
jgi:hypothetical protein